MTDRKMLVDAVSKRRLDVLRRRAKHLHERLAIEKMRAEVERLRAVLRGEDDDANDAADESAREAAWENATHASERPHNIGRCALRAAGRAAGVVEPGE